MKLQVSGLLQNGFVMSERVNFQVGLIEPDLSSHRDINEFFDEYQGKNVTVTIVAVLK